MSLLLISETQRKMNFTSNLLARKVEETGRKYRVTSNKKLHPKLKKQIYLKILVLEKYQQTKLNKCLSQRNNVWPSYTI